MLINTNRRRKHSGGGPSPPTCSQRSRPPSVATIESVWKHVCVIWHVLSNGNNPPVSLCEGRLHSVVALNVRLRGRFSFFIAQVQLSPSTADFFAFSLSVIKWRAFLRSALARYQLVWRQRSMYRLFNLERNKFM